MKQKITLLVLALTIGLINAAPQPVLAMGNYKPQLFLQADRLEYQASNSADLLVWDLQGWYGGDINKLWIKAEGELDLNDSVEEADIELLWSRAVSPFWDLQLGARQDIEPGPGRTYGVIGVQGLAPYWFEVDASAYVSDKGDITAKIEAEYELLITQRLVLQPRVEASLALQNVEARTIGKGLSSIEAGLRLRYEIKREIAPYIGINWTRSTGKTADFQRLKGEDVDNLSFVLGLRLWY